MSSKPPLITILGPTSSGKTNLSIKLAKQFKGEIVSADSRQVYRGMDIGTGKAAKVAQRQAPHHLLDVVSPKKEYTVAHFKRDAQQAIRAIHQKNKLPFLTGGTGFWVQAVTDDLPLPRVKPDKKLRAKLSRKRPAALLQVLHKLDPERAKTIDPHNPYRLIRAIEIIKTTGKPVPPLKRQSLYDLLQIGIVVPQKTLHRRIKQRLDKRLRQGMVAEVKRLHEQGVSWQRLFKFGLEYRYVSLYIRGQLSKQEMHNQLLKAIQQYAKRQLTWWRKDKRIHWIGTPTEAQRLAQRFIDRRG